MSEMFEPPPLRLKLSSHYLLEEEEEHITQGLENASRVSQEEFHSKYEVGNMIGEGRFSQVYAVKCQKSLRSYALKVINKCAVVDTERLRQEITILSSMKHSNIIGIHAVYETEESILLLLELASGGELFTKILEKKRFSEQETKDVLKSLISATYFLHSQNIIHRDIKPENILLASNKSYAEVWISDFGLAKVLDQNDPKVYDHDVDNDTSDDNEEIDSLEIGKRRKRRPRAYTSCGSDCYVAPEVLNSEGYGPSVDMWSIGVVMFILLTGRLPFGCSGNQLYKDIREGNFTFDDSIWKSVSPMAKDLLSRLLTVDPDTRITSEEAMLHPWFSS